MTGWGFSRGRREVRIETGGGRLRLWARWGRRSLWVDTAAERFEVNGRSLLPRLLHGGGLRALEALEDLPLEVVVPQGAPDAERRAYERLAAFLRRRARWSLTPGDLRALGLELLRPRGRGGLAQFLWPGALVLALAWPQLLSAAQREPLGAAALFLGGLALVALGALLRGFPALGYGLAGCLLALHPTGSAAAHALGLALLAAGWTAGLVRHLSPWFWALMLALHWMPGEAAAERLRFLAPFAAAAAANLWTGRVRRLDLGLDGEAAWRFRSLGQAVADLDDEALWALDPERDDQAPPLAAGHAGLNLHLGRHLVPWQVSSAAQAWVFFPGAVLAVRADLRARLLPLGSLRIEGRACTWADAPPAMGERQFLVRLTGPGGERLALLFGRADQGRDFLARFSAWVAPAEAPEAEARPAFQPLPEEGTEAWALRELGLAPGAPWDRIHAAYRRLVRERHPDAHPGATPEERARLEARMKVLNRAYDLLEARART